MDNLFGLEELLIAVPIAVLLCSLIAMKIFKVSFLAALAAVGAPLVMPLRDLPILQHLPDVPHSYMVGGAWAGILFAGVAWNALRPAVTAALDSIGLLRLGYWGLLGGALIVAGLLVVNPEPLATNFPGWKGSAGIILLAASCVSVIRAVVRMLRASFLAVVWGGVALVLACSIFLDKLPQQIGKGDVAKIGGMVSGEFVTMALDRWQVLTREGVGVLRLLQVAQQESFSSDHAESPQSIDA